MSTFSVMSQFGLDNPDVSLENNNNNKPVSFKAQVSSELDGKIKFYENKNQWPAHVLYGARLDAGNIWLEKGRILYHFMDFSSAEENHHSQRNIEEIASVPQALVSATFVGGNRSARTEGKYPTEHYQNFFRGADSANWATEVRGYSSVNYQSFYEGMDLVFFEKDGALKYEFHLSPFSDPTQIKIKYEGYSTIEIQNNGSLEIATEVGVIIENKPFAYQFINGELIEIECEFNLVQDMLTFNLGLYDPEVELIIDPELIFATYAGSVSDSHGWCATYGHDGSAYAAGLIHGNNYPTPAPAWNTTPNLTEDTYATSDVYLSKYSADGSEMLWTNFLGGGDNTQGTETVQSIICDQEDNVYLYGVTSSLDFPVLGGFQLSHAGGDPLAIVFTGTDFGDVGTDIYVSKISADGMDLLGSTYLGGSGNDGVNYQISSGSYTSLADYDSLTSNYSDQFKGEIMLDSLDNIVVVSSTWSTDFPVLDGFQMSNGGQQDAVVFKLTNDCSDLLWSSYYGGLNNDVGTSARIDTDDNVIIVGGTSSLDLPGIVDGLYESYVGGKTDGFVAKIGENGSELSQSTYLGTDDYDQAYFVELNEANEIFVLGLTNGLVPITPGKYNNAGSSIFIWKINNDLTESIFSTVVGNESLALTFLPSAFFVDQCEQIYISGWASGILFGGGALLTDMPTTIDAFQETSPDGKDFYMLVLNPEAEDISYGTYIGGSNAHEHNDGGTSRFDESGVLYQAVCGGCGGFSDFPTTPGVWSNLNLSTNCNSLIYKFDLFKRAIISAPDNDTVCLGGNTVDLIGFPEGGTFSGTGLLGSTFFPDLAGEGEHTIYYSYDGFEGCFESIDSLVMTVLGAFEVTFTGLEDEIVCLDLGIDSIALSGLPEGGIFMGTGVSDDYFNLSEAGLGTHMLYYTAENDIGCVTADSVQISVVDCLDLPTQNKNAITVFPNPFNDYTTINFGEVLADNHTIIIHDILGQEVYYNENVTGSSLEIKKEQLGVGVYVLSLLNSNSEELFSTKLLVE